ncbi:MAG: glycoside hydrolase family 3 C-terminal domain-containing protein [Bacteroidales bacterium]|nr:glycoside hydrolase family 3 C-terminal domain-containing protein [Bacteroidales bacterium]
MKRFALLLALLGFLSCGRQETVELSLDEKLALTHAQSRFSSPGVPRLGIPELWWSDGPNGVRAEALWDSWAQAGWTSDSCTAYPALTCLAATWDESLAGEMGICLAEEALYRGKDVLLGPGVNIMRLPTSGRNFEYMGEDPFLAGKMAAAYIRGVQSKGVAASVKHFALNNQEKARARVDVHVDERALHEIYLPAFKRAVQEGGAWTVMAAYNRIWDSHCSENSRLLTDILRDDWGFDGVVVSDWGAVHSTAAAAAGLDVEMGTSTDGLRDNPLATDYNAFHFAAPYKEKILSGEIPADVLETQVERILRLHGRTTLSPGRGRGRFVCPEHAALARKVGEEGIVLLENRGGLLPLDAARTLDILVVGENAVKKMAVGGGSSSLKAKYEITPLEGIKAAFPLSRVRYERGYVGDPGEVYWGVSSGQDLTDPRTPGRLVEDAVAAAAGADVIIFVGGLNKSKNQDREGRDRLSYTLPYDQDTVVEALVGTGVPLVYVNVSGNPAALPWHGRAGAVVQAWYLGSEAGTALGAVLSGRVNPSGKLPFSWPSALEDTPFYGNERTYPGILREDGRIMDVYYDEGIFVGYRWYDHAGVAPLYPFGHGLSYTTFAWTDLRTSVRRGRLRVSLSLENTGDRAGKETVQVYVGAPAAGEGASYERPLQELKAFRKVSLGPGESQRVHVEIPLPELGCYDSAQDRFVTVHGTYVVRVGASSRDIRLEKQIEL